MYERIMTARMAAEGARRQQLNYHSMPAVYMVSTANELNADGDSLIPHALDPCNNNPWVASSVTKDENHTSLSSSDLNSMNNNGTNSHPAGTEKRTHSESFDRDTILFALELES